MHWLVVWEYLTPQEREDYEQHPEIHQRMEIRRCFATYFQYDPKIYDKHHYKLQLLQSHLRKQAHLYETLTAPCVEELQDDFDEENPEGIILTASTISIPKVLSMFYRHYIEHPNPYAMILSPASLSRFCRIQHSLLNRNLGRYTQGAPLLLPYPMLYYVHIDPLDVDQNAYVAVLWYGCAADPKERNIYTLTKYNVDDKRLLQQASAEEFITSKAVILMGVAAQHWIREATHLEDALQKLTECFMDQ